MKTPTLFLLCLLASCIGARAATLYVDAGSTNAVAPYASLATAARDIQTAVNAAVAGDTVLVADGVYDTGSTLVSSQKSRVYLNKDITLRSLGGAMACRIVGDAHRQGTADAVRCVQATAGRVEGFLLTRGTVTGFTTGGGGAALSGAAVLRDCILFDNESASPAGGGVTGGTLENCWLVGNRALNGGAAYSSKLVNSVALGNSANIGGAFHSCAATNCTVRFNSATNLSGSGGGGAYAGSAVNSVFWDNLGPSSNSNTTSVTITYTCTGGLGTNGSGNLNVNPRFDGLSSLEDALSPCRAAGTPTASFGTDLDGDAWANPPAMGCDQPAADEPLDLRLIVPTRLLVDEPARVFTSFNRRLTSLSVDFGDGRRSDQWLVSHRWSAPGLYPVVVRALQVGMSEPVAVTQRVEVVEAPAPIHVSDATGNDANDGRSWATAKKTIQAGINAQAGYFGVVWVTNGVYATGSTWDPTSQPCRLVATKPVVIRSVNGFLSTRIRGNPGTYGTDQAVRLAYLSGAVLDGFLLEQGSVASSSRLGGGVHMEGTALLRNSVVMDCRGGEYGGGVFQGTVENCRLYGNVSDTAGGGAYLSVLLNSLVVGNQSGEGGGLYGGYATNCTVRFNTATGSTGGGGTVNATLVSSLVGGNRHWGGLPENVGSVFTHSYSLPSADSLALDHHVIPGSIYATGGRVDAVTGRDIDGDAWADPPAAGCDQPAAPAGPGSVHLLAPLTVYEGLQGCLVAIVSARPSSVEFDFGDGSTASGTDHAIHTWSQAGVYTVRVTCVLAGESLPRSVEQSVTVLSNTQYVSAETGDDLNDGGSWARAKRTLQAAVNALPRLNGRVVVTNGTYEAGGTAAPTDGVQTRVVATRSMTIRSVNGPLVTRIVGSPYLHLHPSSVRCVYLKDALLQGFTLTGGGLPSSARLGGGAYLVGLARLKDCILSDNRAGSGGGGAFGGTLENCRLLRNQATQGGGAYESTLAGCLLLWNEASEDGGGTAHSRLHNCTVRYNKAARYAGGAFAGELYNSILWQNTATSSPSNTFLIGPAYQNIAEGDNLPASGGNISTDPLLSSDHRIAPGSPAYRTGLPPRVSGGDLDGEAWATPSPSRGCDEPVEAGSTAPIVRVLGPAQLHVGQPAVFMALVSQAAGSVRLDLGDGTVEPATGYRHHAYGAPGLFQVVATAFADSFPGGVSATQMVQVLPNILYVSERNGNDANHGLSWAFPKRTIQAAVNASRPMGNIWVDDGIYDTGSAPSLSQYALPARVCAFHPLVIRSVNGPLRTTILGQAGALGTAFAVRCAYLHDSTLEGFTLQYGCTQNSSDSGGGAYLSGPSALLRNCVVLQNQAASDGGGLQGGRAENCHFIGNSAYSGAGAQAAALHNCLVYGNQASSNGGGISSGSADQCTIIGNRGTNGGGASFATLRNSIVWGNTGNPGATNAYSCTSTHCNLGNSFVPAGAGNSIANPQFSGLWHLGAGSPCIGTGQAGVATGVDLDGEPWRAPPSRGCDERPLSTPADDVPLVEASARVLIRHNALVLARVSPATTSFQTDFGDGSAPAFNQDHALHAWALPGFYNVVVTAYGPGFEGGLSATQRVEVVDTTIYVSAETGNDDGDGRSWSTAKRTLQAGVSAQLFLDADVVVSNGVYAAGGYLSTSQTTPARVNVERRVNVRSVNGPAFTRILGSPYAQGTTNAMRCLLLRAGTFDGFTLEHGSTRNSSESGGGAFLSTGAKLRNCVLRFNTAGSSGGGVAGSGTVENCLLTGNTANNGGGAADVTLRNCAVVGNQALNRGGGLYFAVARNTTVRGNTAGSASGGGGTYNGTLHNCILWENTAAGALHQQVSATASYSCVQGTVPSGAGNINADPLFAGPYHLQAGSPCAAAGLPAQASGVDMDGTPWGSAPAMGCDLPLVPGGTPRVTLRVPARVSVGQRIPLSVECPAPHASTRVDYGDGVSEAVDSTVWFLHAWKEPGFYSILTEVSGGSLAAPLLATQAIEVVDTRIRVSALEGDDGNDGSSWASAKRTLQAGVDAQSHFEGIVLVEEGIYDQGGRFPAADGLPTRLVVDKPVSVVALRGPVRTRLVGAPFCQGTPSAVRCAYLAMGSLEGFSLLHGCTPSSAALTAAGVHMASGWALLRNCIVMDNQSCGVRGGVARDCLILRNGAAFATAGGTYATDLTNCLVAHNQGATAGGVHSGDITNCTVRFNLGVGVYNGTVLGSIVWDNLGTGTASNLTGATTQYSDIGAATVAGTGNLNVHPRFESLLRLAPDSPCLGAGKPGLPLPTDWEGDPRPPFPAMGCDEPSSAGNPPLLHAPIRIQSGAPGTVLVIAPPGATRVTVDYGDGTTPGAAEVSSHVWQEPGEYELVARVFSASNPLGVVVTQRVAVTEGRMFVSARIGQDTHDGRSWLTAKRTLQAGVDAQHVPGGLVLVAEGIYNFGSTTVSTLGDNQQTRVVVSRPMSVIAVDGPGATRIQGAPGAYNTSSAVRGVYLKDATLEGFTIEHGTSVNTLKDGAGVYMEGAARLRNCVVALNRAGELGGGIYGGLAENCWIVGNHATLAGAAYSSRLLNCAVLYNQASSTGGGTYYGSATNCTVRFNSASFAGGAYGTTLLNSIVWGNTANTSSNFSTVVSTYSCLGGTLLSGTGNRNANPQFFSLFRLLPASPCLSTGRAAFGFGLDLDGEAWRDPPSMGCDEPVSPGPDDPPFLRMIAPSLAEPGVTAPLLFTCSHPTTSLSVDFGDGVRQASDGYATHAWSLPGTYLITVTATVAGFPTPVVLQQPVYVQDDTRFVSATTGLDTQDGRSWATAKQTLQSAVDAQLRVGGVVLATNGVYNTGSRQTAAGEPYNRVMVSRDILIRSVNGPTVTVIEGAPTSATMGTGDSAVRPVYLGAGRLEGFTLRGGFTTATPTGSQNGRGGGAWLAAAAVLDSCVVTHNTAHLAGGGVYGGIVRNSLICGNMAPSGAGAYTSVVSRCTVVGNTASTAGGGVSGGVIDNSVVSGNLAPLNPDLAASTATFTCAPGIAGAGNLDALPRFVDPAALNFRLRADSPGLDAASPVGAPFLDLDRLPRQVGPAPDLGAYEYASATSDSDADGMADGWETTHALDHFNPSDAQQNPDGDAHSNLQEFIAGSLPRDASSQLLLHVDPSEPGLSPFLSVHALAGRAYTLEYRDAPGPGAWAVVPGLDRLRPAEDGPLTFSDPTPLPARIYRVRVER